MSRWSQSLPAGITFPLVTRFFQQPQRLFTAILTTPHSLVLLWTGTSFLGNSNSSFKILFISFSKPSIVNFKLLTIIEAELY